MKPRLLDLFCGAGGCAVGYHRAGFDVVGVDIAPQPNYPYEFHQADALDPPVLYDEFDAIHASPPCQAFSIATMFHGRDKTHVDLVDPVRRLLAASGLPWVIENVPGAPIRADVKLCGEMFGLGVHRHRHFETDGFFVMQPPHSRHHLKGAATNTETREGYARGVYGHLSDRAGASEAMGIGWMTSAELAQAIPPAYTEHIGGYLLSAITAQVTA